MEETIRRDEKKSERTCEGIFLLLWVNLVSATDRGLFLG